MTSSTAVAEQEAGAAHPQLDAPDRAGLAETLRREIARSRPHPVAERTLLLILQAAVEPQAAEPGYRILDRHGAPRLHPAGEGGTPRPFTLGDLIDEQRSRHPGLFLPPEPAAEAVEAQPPAPQESALSAGASEVRAATARFIGSQSERARSLAEQSSVQGRALARSAAGALTALRGRLRRDDPPAGEAGPSSGGLTAPAGPPVAGRLRERFGPIGDADGHRGRFWLGTAAAATAAMVLLAVIVNAPRSPETAPAPASTPALRPAVPANPAPEPPQAARAPSVPDNVTPPPEGDGRGDPEADAPPPPANAVTGIVQVIDTATLKVGGKLVHLFGVEWVRGGQADELARYISGRTVTCLPAPGSENMNCLVDGRDLSEVVLYNGGGRASPEASPELVAAEDHARSERLGVWKR
ncbi:nuclease [Methylobacterium sp. J-076]|uniref:nuclease n=1 Tax=Methylobacterium sp. J-076 TaxID=2836655 RepID=UPI001FB99BF5|nr:nuclease [Methylobacterium sp. J-076]MCJ2014805.1 nuclease [Methylobacterium sp. J-076]